MKRGGMEKKIQNSLKTILKNAVVSLYLWINLYVNRLTCIMERHRVADWLKKDQHYAAYKRLTSALTTHTDLSDRMGKIFHKNGNQKKAGETILVSEKVDFKTETVTTTTKQRWSLYNDTGINT